ncbi:phage virion morphogenesis protein [Halomonas organivorans]|uniref:Phage virion morphogenesis protein n=1 Tax=Halomonas organivorans TaxID=257772 RepID=A0A7W5BXY6_9GAMM|nr:phage virion morphogenesis protein [Halomonas organivorans]MBB3141207.1 phage virion morphogenesis protein [Halomonas organivorans]
MSSTDLDQLEDWVAPLLARLEPKQRRQLARRVATTLRQSQRERIKAQENPDGSGFTPRKPQHRQKAGAIRRRGMFHKLRTAKYLRTRGTSDAAVAGFFGRINRIARVHQYGLHDQVDRDGPRVKYAERRLLGFSEADREAIRDALLEHLTPP